MPTSEGATTHRARPDGPGCLPTTPAPSHPPHAAATTPATTLDAVARPPAHPEHPDDRGGRDARDGEGGFVAGGEALALGALVFVVGAILAINAWGVVDAHMAADAVAREVARTLVESDPGPGLAGTLQAVGAQVADDMGHGDGVSLGYGAGTASSSTTGDPGGLLQRCQRVTVTATLTSTTVRLPFVGGWGAPWTVRGSHTEVVDPFRSGLPGEADCDG